MHCVGNFFLLQIVVDDKLNVNQLHFHKCSINLGVQIEHRKTCTDTCSEKEMQHQVSPIEKQFSQSV